MKIKNMRVLVTGGAGFIGSNLVDELVKDNHVLILDDFSSGKMENIRHHEGKSNVEIIPGDIRNKAIVDDVTKDVDVVYHLAVQCLRVSIKDPEINHEVNATGTLNLSMASLKNRVKRFIHISSSEVYGTAITVPMDERHPCEPTTVYGASKLAAEAYVLTYHKTYGLESMVLRPFNTYGPREHFEGVYGEVIPRFVLRVLNNKPPVIFGDGSQARDFTYVTDTVRGIILASECDRMIGEPVNLARGEEISIKELAGIIANKLKRPDLIPVYEKSRPGDVKRHYAAVQKAQEMFGFKASIGIEEGIRYFIDWFTSQNYDIKKICNDNDILNW